MPKIAILGFAIECNQFAPVSTRADFESRCLLGGDALIAEAMSDRYDFPVPASGAMVTCIGATGIAARRPGVISIEKATLRAALSTNGNSERKSSLSNVSAASASRRTNSAISCWSGARP